jgi:hypothetical protein
VGDDLGGTSHGLGHIQDLLTAATAYADRCYRLGMGVIHRGGDAPAASDMLFVIDGVTSSRGLS